MSFKSFFLFVALANILFCGVERFRNFERGSLKDHFCEIISKSVHWSSRRCHLKVVLFLALAAILFSRA